jgi:hypothetical protein
MKILFLLEWMGKNEMALPYFGFAMALSEVIYYNQ